MRVMLTSPSVQNTKGLFRIISKTDYTGVAVVGTREDIRDQIVALQLALNDALAEVGSWPVMG